MISSAAVYVDFLIQLSSGRIIGPDTLKKMWMQQNLSDCTIVPFATLRWAVHLSAVMEMPARVAVGLQVPVRLALPPPTPPDPVSAKQSLNNWVSSWYAPGKCCLVFSLSTALRSGRQRINRRLAAEIAPLQTFDVNPRSQPK